MRGFIASIYCHSRYSGNGKVEDTLDYEIGLNDGLAVSAQG
jgi:hypothetical protein